MANYLFTKKLTGEITTLINQKHKSYCFIVASNDEDEASQIAAINNANTIFIIVRKDKWQNQLA